MSALDVFAIAILLVLLLAAIAIWVALAMLPGKIARDKNHPQAEAINVGGWVGALLGGILWPLFLIWAFAKPIRVTQETSSSADFESLRRRIDELEASMSGQKGQSS